MTSKLFNFLIKIYCFSFLYMYNNNCKELETIYKLIFDNTKIKKILAKSFISVILIIEISYHSKKDNKKVKTKGKIKNYEKN